jgi:hypothetical protein
VSGPVVLALVTWMRLSWGRSYPNRALMDRPAAAPEEIAVREVKTAAPARPFLVGEPQPAGCGYCTNGRVIQLTPPTTSYSMAAWEKIIPERS